MERVTNYPSHWLFKWLNQSKINVQSIECFSRIRWWITDRQSTEEYQVLQYNADFYSSLLVFFYMYTFEELAPHKAPRNIALVQTISLVRA